MPVPPEALAVLQQFLDASVRRDMPAMRACLCQSNIDSGQLADAGPEGMRFELGEGAMDGNLAVIPVSAFPIGDGAPTVPAQVPPTPAMQLPCVLLQENAAWKIDLAATMERMLGGSIGDAMSQAAAAMGDAMQTLTETLGETMKQAFGDSSDTAQQPPSQDWLNVPTAYAPEEFLPPYDMTPLPKTAALLSAAVGSPVLAEAAITDLLHQLGSDERDTLLTWFDDSLFAAWGDLFSRMATHTPPVPLTGRLRALRIEPAKWIDDRCLVIDGSDLVYRMFLNSTDGYYSDAAVLDLLPGLFAGLPESPDPDAAGKRTIPTDQEEMPLDTFIAHTVPRFMRRISELLGKNVTLVANWDDFHDPRDARQIYRWSLNRILGGLALACLDPDRRAQLTTDLTTIHLNLVAIPDERAAEYAGGTLTIGLDYYRGEKGAFYERDIDNVLAGTPIRFSEPEATEAASDETAETDQSNPTAEAAEATAEDDDTNDAENAAEPTLTPEALNDELFTTAVTSLRQNEPAWAMQLEMAFEHPVTVHLDFDSLGGRYELIQPFIHQALTAALEALTPLGYDPAFKPKIQPTEKVTISSLAATATPFIQMTGKELTIKVPIEPGDHRAPTQQVSKALHQFFN